MTAPRDLHELLSLLEPYGWRKSEVMPGLWLREGRRFIRPVRPGQVEVYGVGVPGLVRLPLAEVVDYVTTEEKA